MKAKSKLKILRITYFLFNYIILAIHRSIAKLSMKKDQYLTPIHIEIFSIIHRETRQIQSKGIRLSRTVVGHKKKNHNFRSRVPLKIQRRGIDRKREIVRVATIL